MSGRQLHLKTLFGFAAFLVPALFPGLASAQLKIDGGESLNARIGIQGQFWLSENQDLQSRGYAQNLYLRRIRFIFGGQLSDDITFFFETDSPNLGKSPKAMGAGFIVQDAFLEWKIRNAFRLDGGLMLVPYSRQALQSTLSYYTVDISPVSTVNNTATQSSVLRDLGFQARGFLHRDHFLYRAGLFSGVRQGNARNSFRSAGYLQYDFFGTETGYTLIGTALGKQKILAVNVAGDRQSKYYSASMGVAANIPVRGGDEVGGQVQFMRYDGGATFLMIPKQNDALVELDYYSNAAKLQPFLKYESQNFTAAGERVKNIDRCGMGVNYYVHGQNLKLTAQYNRALPRHNSTLKPGNEFTLQFQVFYF